MFKIRFSFKKLKIAIIKPTRIRETTATLLNHLYTHDVNPQNSGVLIFQVSDHLPVYVFGTKHIPITKSKFIYKDHSSFNKEKFREDLYDNFYNNYEQITGDDLDNCYTYLISTFITVLDKHAPMKQLSRRETKF